MLSFALCAILALNVHAQRVRPDSSFGRAGYFVSDTPVLTLPQISLKHALQPDGKIVFCSNRSAGFFVTDVSIGRLKANGSLDSGFGRNGISSFPVFAGGFNLAVGLAIQPDGKIVTGGMANDGSSANQVFIARLNANGSLDAGFGRGGIGIYDINDEDERITDLRIQRNGKILICGIASTSSASDSGFILRVTRSGALDNTFAGGGIFRYKRGGRQTNLYAMDADSSGKIVAGGSYNSGSNAQDFLLLRLDSNGVLDNSFGTSGVVSTDFFNDYDEIHSLKILANQSVIAAGYSYNGNNDGIAVIKYSASGVADNSFGTAGKKYIGDSTMPMRGYSMALQPDGKIVVGGQKATSSGTSDLVLLRLSASGVPDTGFFPRTGYITADLFGDEDRVHSVSLQPDGKIAVYGTSIRDNTTQEEQPFVARYVAGSTVIVPPNTVSQHAAGRFSIYPSPVSGDRIYISGADRQTLRASLYNSGGALVRQATIAAEAHDLELPATLADGVYFLILQDAVDNTSGKYKIVLRRN